MSEQLPIIVSEPRDSERAWLGQQLRNLWGSTTVVSRGQVHNPAGLPALIAFQGDDPVGLATFQFTEGDCELVTIDALQKGRGIGSALFAGVVKEARNRWCGRLWLITTNDNLDAMRFYQRQGMRMVALHRNAVNEARLIKPSIPEIGEYGIPLHDELEFELRLR